MNVVIITDVITRRAGGVFNAVRDMFKNPVVSKVTLTILSYFDDKVEEDIPSWKGLPIHLFKPHFFLYSRKLRCRLLSSDAEIYHQEGLWRYSHLMMELWKKKKNRPIVCTPHGMLDPFIIRKQGKLKRIVSNLFFQKSLESVSCFQALCLKEYEDIRAYGLNNPVAIIPNGVNLPSREIADKYKKTDNKKHLLFLGRLHEKKGVDLLIKAFADIIKTNADVANIWHLDLVGWNHEGGAEKLSNLVKLAGISDFVTFHGGLYGEEKEKMYAICEAYILPSHGEGLPMTVLEAWSWKKPVLITPHCHFPEAYEASAAIYIDDNVESVKQGLLTLFAMNKEELSDMGKNGYELVCNNYTWDKAAEKLIAVYEWLLRKRNRPNFVYEK